ncbi:hypothetical protein PHK61_13905 [Actinomycetospora lutea]|uniref:hypothetical protein n=1 Tax=Actinomycetospora lutea TaxID=663604 RepID=UPI0023671376|nr:hypothetical protein [Actinomycetospora lutea]MDD7939513.1 hypothetical protein [Actinomycetospora lutea]
MDPAPRGPQEPRASRVEQPVRVPRPAEARVRNLEHVVDAALDAAARLRRTPRLELHELRRAGTAVSDLCDALADTCGHLAQELSAQSPEPTERAHAAIEHLYTARDALNDAGDATRRTTSTAADLYPADRDTGRAAGKS